ncbi:MAG: cytochrome c3 family protein, partial [Hyphomicrobiaceae bacterium]
MGDAGLSNLLSRIPQMTTSVARWCVLLSSGIVVLLIGLAADSAFLMPGPLTTSHRFSDGCVTCHSTIGKGQFGWLHGLVRFASPKDDSAACLKCHTVGSTPRKPDSQTVFMPHGLSKKQLDATARAQSKRQKKIDTAEGDQSAVGELRAWVNTPGETGPETVFCATCHKEHKGTHADLTAMTDQRCHTCHQTKFDSFDKTHPPFVNYPFQRRTRIAFDHAQHFDKHFKETRAKRPDAKFIPETCASCHESTKDKRHMNVKPFGETCATCHLPQIVGAERATGPKGLALLTLPTLDLETLREKKAPIGEWPEDSDAELTPLMQLLLAGTAERRDVLLATSDLDLQDLSKASKAEIEAVVELVWEIKKLMHSLTMTKASDILKRIGHVTGGKVSKTQIARLLATMPRDVLVGAQREWLPELQKEIALRGQPNWKTTLRAKASKVAGNGDETEELEADEVEDKKDADKLVSDPAKGRWYVNVLGEIVQEGAESEAAKRAAKGEVEGPVKPAVAGADSGDAPAEEEISLDESATPAVDAESWSEFGGWYRKDFAILYKPTGHADPFMRAWLDFSGGRS